MISSLVNHFLIAMPGLDDSYFERSLIYICEHNEKGAMGLVLNIPLELDLYQLLSQMKLENASYSLAGQPVLSGGPVHTDRGFVLHTPMERFNASITVSEDIMMTTSLDILSTLGTSAEPKQYVIALGYAGWDAGQLEDELKENSWLTVPASTDIIFDIPAEHKWEAATQMLGFDIWQMAPQVGHA